MTINDFLTTYQNTMQNKKIINPLTVSPVKNIMNPVAGQGTSSFGSAVPSWLTARTKDAADIYGNQKSEKTTALASDYTKMAAGQIPVDQYGIVQNKSTDFSSEFNNQLKSISATGNNALATAEAKAQWQQLQDSRDMAAGFTTNIAPGASGNNKGAQAVSMAMNAMSSGLQYKWGGTSLSSGVDCSGLVYSIYKSLGVTLPRSSYEQAKSGKKVSLSNLLPGDLVFYNTGSRDPNGIGSLSHVSIYIGNGQVISALNSNSDITIQKLNNNGGAVMAVRPW